MHLVLCVLGLLVVGVVGVVLSLCTNFRWGVLVKPTVRTGCLGLFTTENKTASVVLIATPCYHFFFTWVFISLFPYFLFLFQLPIYFYFFSVFLCGNFVILNF